MTATLQEHAEGAQPSPRGAVCSGGVWTGRGVRKRRHFRKSTGRRGDVAQVRRVDRRVPRSFWVSKGESGNWKWVRKGTGMETRKGLGSSNGHRENG